MKKNILFFIFIVNSLTAQKGLIKEFSGHSGCVYDLCISPDEKYIATASLDNTAKLWDIKNGKLLSSFAGNGEELYAVCFDTEGKQLIMAGRYGNIQRINIKSGQISQDLNHFENAITRSLVPGYGNILYFAAESDNIEIHYKNNSVKNVSCTNFGIGSIFNLRNMGRDNSIVLSCQYGLAKMDSSGKISKVPGISQSFCTDVSSDGNWTLAGLTGIDIYDLKTFHKTTELKDYNDFSFKEQFFSAAFNSKSSLVIAGYETGEIVIWDIKSKDLVTRFFAHANFACNNGAGKSGRFSIYNGGINAIKFMRDGKHFFTCGNDNTVKLWNIDSLIPNQYKEENRNAPLSIKLTSPTESNITISNFAVMVEGYIENPVGRVYMTTNGDDVFIHPETYVFSKSVFLEGKENKITIVAKDSRNVPVTKEIFVTKTGLANMFADTPSEKSAKSKTGKTPVQSPITAKPPVYKEPVSLEEIKLANIYAVIVGVSSYKYDQDIKLKYAAKDAKAYYDFIRSPQGGSVPEKNISVLMDSAATREDILAEFEDKVYRAGTDDIFIFYYSGHGKVTGNNDELCFLAFDSKTKNNNKLGSTSVKQSDILSALENSKTQKKLMFIDACHSGLFAVKGQKDDGHINNTLLGNMSRSLSSLTILTSSMNNEDSFEDDELGGGHGIYTYYLLEGLRGKADSENSGNKNNFVTVYELDQYVKEKVNARAGKIRSTTQRPYLHCVSCLDFPLSKVK